MQIGKLRHRINILAPSKTHDAAGQPGDPIAFSTAWAQITALLGRELAQAQQVVSEVTHRITIRYRKNITAEMFVQYQARVFQIQAVLNPDEQTKLLQLLCVERNDGTDTSIVLLIANGRVTGTSPADCAISFSGPTHVTVRPDDGGAYKVYLVNGSYAVTVKMDNSTITTTPISYTVVVSGADVLVPDFVAA